MYNPIRVAISGAGKRSNTLYAPLLNVLKDHVEFVGVWGRSEDKARELGEKYHVPWFTDLRHLRNDLDLSRLWHPQQFRYASGGLQPQSTRLERVLS